MNVAELRAVVTLDDRAFQDGLRKDKEELRGVADEAGKTGSALDQLKSRFDAIEHSGFASLGNRLGNSLTMGLTVPLGLGAIAATKWASAMNEATNKADVVFGRSAAEIQAWSKTSLDAFGMSEKHAISAASTFGNLFSTMGLGNQASTDMSKQLTELAADLSSFHDIPVSEALEKLQAGLVGEIRPMRELGVMIDENTVKQKAMQMGLADSSGELTDAAKVQARYALIIEQTKFAHGDYKRTQDELANSTRHLQEEFEQVAAQTGKDLLPLAKDLVHQADQLLKSWNALSPAQKQLALEIAAVAIAAGPTVKLLVGMWEGWQKLIALKDTAVAMWTAKTIAIKANTAALEENAAAGAAAGGGGPGIGTGLMLGASAIGVGYWAGSEIEKAWDPWGIHKRDRALAASNAKWGGIRDKNQAEIDRRLANGEAHWENGHLRTGPSPEQAQAKAYVDQDKLLKSHSEEFAARLEEAKAATSASPDETNARDAAKAQIPVLQKRAEQLKQDIAQLKQGTENYWKATKEAAQVQNAIGELRAAAIKEEKDQAKKAQDKALALSAAQFDAARQAAQSAVEAAPDEAKNRAAAQQMIPVLAQRQRDLIAEAKTVQQGTKEYAELSAKWWQAQTEINQIQRAAATEQKAGQKKAADERKRGLESYYDVLMQQAEIRASEAAEGYEARGKANELIQVIDQKEKALLDLAKRQTGQEYWDTIKEYWSLEAKAAELQQRADHEVRDQAKKAVEKAKKARAEKRELLDLNAELASAQVKNNPFLNDRQRAAALVPYEVAQYRETLKPVEGETDAERLRRQIEAEKLKGEIVAGALGGRHNPYAAAQLLGQLNQMGAAAAQAPARPRLDPMVARAAAESGIGGTAVLNVNGPGLADLFRDPRFQAALRQLVMDWNQDGQGRAGYQYAPP